MKKLVRIGGKLTHVYSIGELARRLRRSRRTIQAWEKSGIIPKPIVARIKGRRWYLAQEIELYAVIFEQERLRRGRRIDETKFTPRIHLEIQRLKASMCPQNMKYQGPKGPSSTKLDRKRTSPHGKNFYYLGLTM